MKNRVSVFAPASVANLGPGFDTLGMAVEGLGDIITAYRTNSNTISICRIVGDSGKLPLDSTKNTVTIAANDILRQANLKTGIEFEIEKGLPLASGLGSSAASAVGGAVAAYELLGRPSNVDVLAAAMEGESYISRSYHADNVAPSLFGGIILTHGYTTDSIYHLPVPDNLYLVLVSPKAEVPTAEARAILPKEVEFQSMVRQTKGIALLIHAIYANNIDLITEAMRQDFIVEPARANLMPYYHEAKKIAYAKGAMAIIISGAGPTWCVVSPTPQAAEQIGSALNSFYDNKNIGATYYITRPSSRGAYVIDEN